METVTTITALSDNFTYLYPCGENGAVVIDPGESSKVLRILKEQGLEPAMVLCTHHHRDHVGGAGELKIKTGCEIVGGDGDRIAGIDRVVVDGEVLIVGKTKIEVISTPGHTRTSVCYYICPSGARESGILWTGDTMFAGGCGRILECDAVTMLGSLEKLALLPDETLVYPGHDYTMENYEFALSIERNNQAVTQRQHEVQQALLQGRQTVPTTMGLERLTNIFLRSGEARVKAALGMANAEAVEVFAALRRRKDVF